MTEYPPRPFHADAEIERIGEGLLARTLPRDEGTHEAHLAATTYLLTRQPDVDIDAQLPGIIRRPDVDIDRQLPDIIRRYNESVGGVNDDTQGYHETITRLFLHGVRLFFSEAGTAEGGTVPRGTVPVGARPLHDAGTIPKGTVPARSLHELVNALLPSPMGRRDWPLHFYSPELLFSVGGAAQYRAAPDVRELP